MELTPAQCELVEQNLKLATLIALDHHRALPPHVELDDIQQAARMGLIEAALRFDASRGATFQTFARWRINGAIRDYLRGLDAVSKEDRARINAGEAGAPVHLNVDELYIEPRAAQRSPEDASIAAQITAQIATLIEGLSGRKRTIVREYYYHERTMADIGDALGVKEARISQVHKKTIEALRQEPGFVANRAVFRFAMNSGLLGLLALVFAFAPAADAQTRVTTPALAGTPGTNPRVWVVLPTGTLAEAELENIQLVIENGKAILRAIQPPQALPPVKSKHVLTAPRADFALAGTLDTVHRNGLLQAEGDDYTIVAVGGVNTLRFNANAVPQAGDIVQIRELR